MSYWTKTVPHVPGNDEATPADNSLAQRRRQQTVDTQADLDGKMAMGPVVADLGINEGPAAPDRGSAAPARAELAIDQS